MTRNTNAHFRRAAASLGAGPTEVYKATQGKVPYETVRSLFYTDFTPGVHLAQRIAKAVESIAVERAEKNPFGWQPPCVTVELLWPECTVDGKEVGA